MSKVVRGSLQMQDKFRGCLVGALLGDCLGAPFEGLSFGPISRDKIEDTIGLKSKKLASARAGSFTFTDDSAMTQCICRSLLAKKCFDAHDMASSFLNEYKQHGNRGYGSGMLLLFEKWNSGGGLSDPFLPAREQFSGSGSYGNGAAMRVAPVALFRQEEKEVAELARFTALLTHSHKHGYNGAILQALAIHKVLFSSSEIHKLDFVKRLKDAFKHFEDIPSESYSGNSKDAKEREGKLHFSRRSNFTFVSQLEKLEAILDEAEELQSSRFNAKDVVNLFGNDISAQQAVPAAICTFIQCLHLDFSETLLSAFSLGGDTDTIGTMTGALAGAYFGYSSIPVEWRNSCEGVEEAISFADQFYDKMFAK